MFPQIFTPRTEAISMLPVTSGLTVEKLLITVFRMEISLEGCFSYTELPLQRIFSLLRRSVNFLHARRAD
jgi:hypothetical protein